MSDIHFKATSQRAFENMRETLDFGGATDTLDPGSVKQTTDSRHWHFNVRLPVSVDAEQIKKNFGRLANATQKTVASKRRIGTDHEWTSVTNADGEVWLIDPPPQIPSRIWLGDAAPAVGRS